MENDAEIALSLRHQGSKSAKEKILTPRPSRSSNLRDGKLFLKPEKPSEHADQHCEIVRNKHDGQKRQSKKATEADELVKYMSDLPSYLQSTGRGGNVQEKALNFGVLDWKRLERWKYEQKKVFGGRNVHSSSSSQTHSSSTSQTSLSTYGSSAQSGSSGCKISSHSQKKKSPSLDFYLNISAKEGFSDVMNERSSGQDTVANEMKIASRRDRSIGKQQQRYEHGKSNRNDRGLKFVSHNTCHTSENAISNLKGHKPGACAKGRANPMGGESISRMEQFQDSGLDHFGENCVNRPNTYDFLSIRESPKERSPESCPRYGASVFDDIRPTELNHNIFSDDFQFQFTLSSDIPHSCPFPCNSQSGEWPDISTQDSETSSNVRHSYVDSGERPIIRVKEKHDGQQNQSTAQPTEPSVVEPFNRLGPINVKSATGTAKNQSPSLRSTPSLSKTSRSFSFREVSAAQQVNLTFNSATSSNSSNTSDRDKASASSRAKSSPLRRMLDPLLKPKASNHLSSDNLVSGSHEDGGSTHKHQTSGVLQSANGSHPSDVMSNSSTSSPVKRNLKFSNFTYANMHEKHAGLKKHAALQLAYKNGRPLFTFTFNDGDILAAVMRKVYLSGKDDFKWVYTFYSVHGVKKKGRWINPGSGKGKWLRYASNIVGQMKVSCSQCQKFTGDGSYNHVMVREFVLFGVEPKQAAQDTLDLIPSSELAAIVINVPKEKANSGADGRKSNVSQMEPARCFLQGRDSRYLPENQNSSITVILPGGVHSQPATAGIPSTLIDRWRTGGSCDCGGWDEGCTLRVLSSQCEESNILSSSHACHISNESLQVDLFIQGGADGNEHVFNLVSFEGLYAVNFNASISLLQAFSICIAILHGGKPANLSELLNILETQSSPDLDSTENDRIKASGRSQGGNTTSYVPYPPHSPVGRV